MKKFILLIFFTTSSQMLFAQSMGINTLTPDPSAALDIHSDHQGLLVPRVSLQSLNDSQTITAPSHSLLIYNMNGNLNGGRGYYYNEGTDVSPNWKRFIDDEKIAFGVKGVKPDQDIPFRGVTPNEGAVIKFDSEIYDFGNSYDELGSGTFTAPVKGVYEFEVRAVQDVSINSFSLETILFKKRNNDLFEIDRSYGGYQSTPIIVSDILEVGDQIVVQVFTHQYSPNNPGVGASPAKLQAAGSYFNGRLVTKFN